MENENRNEFIITWRIKNFSSWCIFPLYQSIYSAPCTAENLEKNIYIVSLSHTTGQSLEEKYLNCSFYSELKENSNSNEIPIELTIELIDEGGETLQSKTFPIFAMQQCEMLEWENIMTFDKLFNKMKNWSKDTLTVRCHITGEVQTGQPKIECEAMTKICVERCSSLWNMSKPHSSDWYKRRICLLPDVTPVKIDLSAPEDDVLINIKREKKTELFVTCRMSLLDNDDIERYSQSANYFFSDCEAAIWKFPAFFTKAILEDNKDTLLYNDKLSLNCSFTVTNGIDVNKVRYRSLPLINAPCTEVPVSSLQSDLHDMFTSKKHADVKLRVDKEIFSAHKCLLAARSPVFSAMFDQDMLESRTGIVDVDDTDVKTMKFFLEFMYTGTVEGMNYDIASKLLIAAEKYQVLSLKEKCASFLMSILSEENVCELITLSDMIGHELLKASSLDYIKSHAGDILRSPQWSKLVSNDVQLGGEIVCVLSTDIASGKQCRLLFQCTTEATGPAVQPKGLRETEGKRRGDHPSIKPDPPHPPQSAEEIKMDSCFCC